MTEGNSSITQLIGTFYLPVGGIKIVATSEIFANDDCFRCDQGRADAEVGGNSLQD